MLVGGSLIIIGGILSTILARSLGVEYLAPDSNAAHFMQLIYLLLAFGFFGWFWTHGGQTLGMRAWKIRVVDLNNNPLTWTQAGMRFLWSLASWMTFGLGYIWAFFDPDKLTLHDRMSKTRLVRVANNKTKQ
jgi:uncharacterized RDD family membrane protein YckC